MNYDPHPFFVKEVKYSLERITHIALHSDITFATMILGFSMILWGIFGLIYTPDLEWFAKGFSLVVPPWFWGVNSCAYGVALIHLSVRHFPAGRTLMIGAYGAMVWSWIALGRPNASFSSGMTLNLVIIFMSCVIIQRSGRK